MVIIQLLYLFLFFWESGGSTRGIFADMSPETLLKRKSKINIPFYMGVLFFAQNFLFLFIFGVSIYNCQSERF